ncbi:MAG: acyltransferase family protein, partial [Pirellula sp.]
MIRRIEGLDCLRVMAMVFVVVFHALVLVDRASWTQFGPISMGTFGVLLFMAISGALIGGDSRDP